MDEQIDNQENVLRQIFEADYVVEGEERRIVSGAFSPTTGTSRISVNRDKATVEEIREFARSREKDGNKYLFCLKASVGNLRKIRDVNHPNDPLDVLDVPMEGVPAHAEIDLPNSARNKALRRWQRYIRDEFMKEGFI